MSWCLEGDLNLGLLDAGHGCGFWINGKGNRGLAFERSSDASGLENKVICRPESRCGGGIVHGLDEGMVRYPDCWSLYGGDGRASLFYLCADPKLVFFSSLMVFAILE